MRQSIKFEMSLVAACRKQSPRLGLDGKWFLSATVPALYDGDVNIRRTFQARRPERLAVSCKVAMKHLRKQLSLAARS
jgi:hypothetical protein